MGSQYPDTFTGSQYPDTYMGSLYPDISAGRLYPDTSVGSLYPDTSGGSQYPDTYMGSQYPDTYMGSLYPDRSNSHQTRFSGCKRRLGGGRDRFTIELCPIFGEATRAIRCHRDYSIRGSRKVSKQ